MSRRLVVHADGGSRGNPGPAAGGAVVTDQVTGEVLAEEREFIGVATNNAAEYRGLIAGLRAARRIDPDAEVLVRMDSRLVVEQLSGRWKIKHPALRPLAARAAAILPARQVTYEWIPREHNRHADRLANEAMDAGGSAGATMPAAPEQFPQGDPQLPLTGTPLNAAERNATPAAVPTAAPSSTPAAAPASLPGAAGAGTTFVLLRHGETALTPERRLSGSGAQDDPPLSPTGREQARRAAAELAARGGVDVVLCSPLARCRETAAMAAGRLGLPVEVEPGLLECDFGAWEGLTFADVRQRHPQDLAAWLASPDACPTGGGESLATTAARVIALREELTERHLNRTVLLVTHLTVIKTLVAAALGAPPQSAFRMDLTAASLSSVGVRPDGTSTLKSYNETSHLRG